MLILFGWEGERRKKERKQTRMGWKGGGNYTERKNDNWNNKIREEANVGNRVIR